MLLSSHLKCWAFFLLVFSLNVLSSPAPLSNLVRQYSPVNSLEVKFHENNEKMHISFEAFGLQFNYWMIKHHELFTQDYKIIVSSPRGPVETRATHWAYRGMGAEDLLARVTLMPGASKVFKLEDLIFHGLFDKNNETFTVDPRHWYQVTDLHENVKLVAYRVRDEIAQENCACGVEHKHHHPNDFHSIIGDAVLRKRSIEQIAVRDTIITPAPQPCPQKRALKIVSFAADNTYIQRLVTPDAVKAQINMIINSADKLYQQTVNIRLSLDSIYLVLPNDTVGWNTNCRATIDDKLNALSRWRDTVSEKSGLWHLMTNCYPTGTVGLAWVSQVCLTRGRNALKGGYANGAGVSSNLPGNNAWRVVAHEIGHNFGAEHSNEGIMYPDVINVEAFSRQSQNEMCAVVGQQLSGDCFTDDATCKPDCTNRVCGNNGCGGSCGPCPRQHQCFEGKCVCLPICGIRECGDNGCGGSCGVCPDKTFCADDIGACLSFSAEESIQIVERHNFFRKALKLPDLKYNNTLAALATKWSGTCTLQASPLFYRGFPYGENFDFGPAMNITSAIASWGLERASWLCQTRDCRGQCSEYVQMVGDKVTDVGCGQTVCGGNTFIVCEYGPQGLSVVQEPFPKESCTACTPICKTLNLQCGSVFNGCDDEYCGTCPRGSHCMNGTCVCFNQTSCSAERANCGPISLLTRDTCTPMATTCGECSADQTCSVTGDCRCKKSDCARAGLMCGSQADSCGTFNCGTCLPEFRCQSGSCVSGGNQCTPNVTCDAANLQCGMLTTSCGQMSCGICGPSEICIAGRCNCKPLLSCSTVGKECGTIYDGCKTINCGLCREGNACIRGKCSRCTTQCHIFAECQGSTCVCLPGHRGNGVDSCEEIGDLQGVEGLGRQSMIAGGQNWWIGNQLVSFASTATFELMQIDPVYASHVDSRSSIGWQIRKDSSSEAGIAFLVKDASNFMAIKFGPSLDVYFWFRKGGKDNIFLLGSAAAKSQYLFTNFVLKTDGKKYTVFVDGKQVGKSFFATFVDKRGRFGYLGTGTLDISFLSTSTEVDVILQLANCITPAKLIDSLSIALDVPTTQFKVTAAKCLLTNSQKRSNEAIEQSSSTELQPGNYTVTIIGSSRQSAPAIALQLQASFMEDLPRLRGNSLTITSMSTVTGFVDSPDTFDTTPPGDGGDDGGLAGWKIFLIVIGCLGAVVLLVFVLFLFFKPKGGEKDAHMMPLHS